MGNGTHENKIENVEIYCLDMDKEPKYQIRGLKANNASYRFRAVSVDNVSNPIRPILFLLTVT